MCSLRPPRPNAIATLLTSDDFLPGAQTVIHSVKKTLKSPSRTEYHPPELIVIVTPQVSEATRETLLLCCDRIIDVEAIPCPSSADGNDDGRDGVSDPSSQKTHVSGWANAGYTKLRLWELTVYDKIVYVDADCVVLKDIGHLLYDERFAADEEWNGLSAAPDIFPPDRFNGGFLVVRPNLPTFRKMMSQIDTLHSYDSGDTGFLNAFFPGWYDAFPPSSRLSFGYNAQRTLHHFTHKKQRGYWDSIRPRLRVIHYSSTPKPWDRPRDGAAGELELLWWEEFDESGRELNAARDARDRANVASAPTGAAAAASAASSGRPPSAREVHLQVTKKYKEFRKEGMDPRTAMSRAREESGHAGGEADADPGRRVAAMFGMPM